MAVPGFFREFWTRSVFEDERENDRNRAAAGGGADLRPCGGAGRPLRGGIPFAETVNAAAVQTELDFSDANTPAEGDGYAWDASTNTLTLSNFQMNAADGISFPDDADVTIKLEGDNVITSGGYGIYCENDLTIQGDGSLKVDAVNRAINADDSVTIDIEGDISLTSTDSEGIYASQGVEIAGNNLTINSDSCSIYSF